MNKMQTASARLKLSEHGDVPIDELTPAEAVVLNKAHETNAKGVAVHAVVLGPEVQRTDKQEIQRLREKYVSMRDKTGASVVEKVFPGEAPALPKTFKEAGIEAEAPAKEEKPAVKG